MENYFEKTPTGALNTMALITAQVLVERGLTNNEAANITNDILSKTVSIITGETKAVITEDFKHENQD